MKKLLLFCIIVGILAGCTDRRDHMNQDADQKSPALQTKNMSTDPAETNSDDHDITDKQVDVQKDIGIAKDVAHKEHYRVTKVTVNGSQMWAIVQANHKLTVHQRMVEEADLRKLIHQKLTQYDVTVRIDPMQ